MMRRKKEISLAGKDVISFDFGHYTSKLVYGRVSKNNIVVEKAIEFSTPTGAIEKGTVVDIPLLANRLKELLRDEKMRPSYAIATIENTEIITREIVLPTATEEQMEKVLEFEAQQYLPIEMNTHIVQSKMIETFQEANVNKTRFLTTAVPESIARSYFALLQAADLNGVTLDIHSNSLDKLVQSRILLSKDPAFYERAAAVIDFGYSHINVMLFENGKFKFNRLISQGTDSIDRVLMSSFGYSRKEIEEVKRSIIDLNEMMADNPRFNSSLPETTLRARDVVKTVLNGWARELDRVFRFFSTRLTTNSIDTLYIYGGMTNFPGFDAYMQEATGIETKCIEELTGITFKGVGSQPMVPFINALGSMIRR